VSANRQFTEADLHAYLDNEVGAADRAAIEAWLQRDPSAAERLREYRALDQRIRGAFEFVLDEPKSRDMQDAVRHWRPVRRTAPWQIAAALALVAGLSGGLGYWLRGIVDPAQEIGGLPDVALSAHAVYAPEVRHPVEVVAAEEAHLVGWLTKRVGHQIKAPSLASAGFTLVGGRLLPDAGSPAAQLMYENKQGRRLTLYVREDKQSSDSAFAISSKGDVNVLHWVERPLAFALVGAVPREELQKAAHLSYEQLHARPGGTQPQPSSAPRGSR
jgi:anti-sigma factor RsiW